MRARNKIYHIDCFRCVACSRQLVPGDEFALRDDGLFCKADNDIVERSGNNNNSPLDDDNLEDSKDNIITTLSDSKSGENSPGTRFDSVAGHQRLHGLLGPKLGADVDGIDRGLGQEHRGRLGLAFTQRGERWIG